MSELKKYLKTVVDCNEICLQGRNMKWFLRNSLFVGYLFILDFGLPQVLHCAFYAFERRVLGTAVCMCMNTSSNESHTL